MLSEVQHEIEVQRAIDNYIFDVLAAYDEAIERLMDLGFKIKEAEDLLREAF